MSDLEELKRTGHAPAWMTDESFLTLSRGYLLPDETPYDMYMRLALAAAKYVNHEPFMHTRFFNAMWNNWLCPSSPVCANLGTTRGLPISCYGSAVSDSLDEIFNTTHETAMLSKHGGGIGHYWGDVRGRGVEIAGNGASEGIIPWLKIEDTVISSVSQGGVRRGSSAQYLPISHPDIDEFIDVRRQTGDETRRCRSVGFHHAVICDDEFMQGVESGNAENRRLWSKLLKARWEMGEPYIMFGSAANRDLPPWYLDKNLSVKSSQLCSEIFLHSDKDHTYVCCLSSLNLARWDEWKDTNAVETAIFFLDAVMSEFIEKAKGQPGFDKAVRFAEKSRALGLGVLGWHTYLQKNSIPFESYQAMTLNNGIFRHIRHSADRATASLASLYGEPEWCVGHKVRNSHLLAVAPTLSNSIISGGLSEGVQPVVANIYVNKTAKGTFFRRNPALELLLSDRNKNTQEVWQQIINDRGSVRNLAYLTEEEKLVFLTAREINQYALVRQAGQRQKYIDQGQSLNLFFSSPPDDSKETSIEVGKYVHDVHMEAWHLGLKSLYYLRTESPLQGDRVVVSESECASCEG